MKKVALVLIVSVCAILLLTGRGRITDTTRMPASAPDMLPYFLITLGNYQTSSQDQPARTSSTVSVPLEHQRQTTQQLKDAVSILISFFNNN
ncbi:MAG TPA: hypothetical protein VM802_31165 [Chitinophaga sp.]|uniref:hypothetical protein n=1 Tax=Chitinophaga sp. TaxID=1869181 RepID=UPI002C2B84F8|nr:hypothetical protein [Chitinophaga sp.]HVI49367.1 hypothetical protein [Chitinophaga sp.]